MTWKGEYLERALQTAMQDDISTALDAVETIWATAGFPITLPEPVTWGRGFRLNMVELPSTYYPYILTMVLERSPQTSQGGRIARQSVTYMVTVSVFVIDDSETVVDDIAHRYAQALCDIFSAAKNRTVAGFTCLDQEPEVTISPGNTTHLKLGDTGDNDNPADVDYIRLIDIILRYGQ